MKVSLSLLCIVLGTARWVSADEEAGAAAKKNDDNKFGAILEAAKDLNWGANYDPQK
jgi:hypothetical protein